eukprot:tig00000828_g4607.t1
MYAATGASEAPGVVSRLGGPEPHPAHVDGYITCSGWSSRRRRRKTRTPLPGAKWRGGESAFRALNFFTLPSRAWTDDPGKTISSLKPKRIETYALSCSRAHFVHDSGVEAVHSLRMKRTGSWSTLYQKYCEPCLETLDREPRSSGQMPSVARARSPQGAQAHRKLGARPAGLALRARFPP